MAAGGYDDDDGGGPAVVLMVGEGLGCFQWIGRSTRYDDCRTRDWLICY